MTNLNDEQAEEVLKEAVKQQEKERQFLISRGWRKAEKADYINDKWAKEVETWIHPNGELYPLCKFFGTEKTQAIDKAQSEFTIELGWKGCGHQCLGDDGVMAGYLHPVSGKLYHWFEMLEIAFDLDNDDTRIPHDHLCGMTQELQEILKDKTVEENDIIDLDFKMDFPPGWQADPTKAKGKYHFLGIRKNGLPLPGCPKPE